MESSDSVEKPWLKFNLDTGASVTVFPKDMFEAGEPNEMRLKTASGEVVKAYGKATVHGKDTRGLMRKLNGEVADVRKILVSAAKLHETHGLAPEVVRSSR